MNVNRVRAARVPVLLIAAFALLSVAWIWGNPPGAAPDEGEHYIRAVAAGHGHLTGSLVPRSAAYPFDTSAYRTFTIPAGLAPPRQFACDAFKSDQPANCADVTSPPILSTQVVSAAGEYMPTAYLIPGLLTRLASDPFTALSLGRVGSALVSLSLLAAAAALLWSRAQSPLPLVGLTVAITAQLIFLITEVGPDGLETAAAIAYAAALLRLSRLEPATAWSWAGLGYAGVLLAATRPLGPGWIFVGVMVILLFVGPARVFELLRRQARAAAITATAITGACVVNVWWVLHNPATSRVAAGSVFAHVADIFGRLPELFNEMVGVFGWLDTTLPSGVLRAWGAVAVLVSVLAFSVGTARQRLALGVTVVGIVAGAMLLGAYLSLAFGYNGQGGGVQGRYLMPMAVWWPLLSGEIVYRQRARLWALPRRLLFFAVASFAALFQLYAWLFNARRYAVGESGPVLFVVPGAWAPPGGWLIWIAVATFACATFLASGAVSLSRNPAVGD